MLDSSKIVVSCKNAKASIDVIRDYVFYVVRTYERKKAYKPIEDVVIAINEKHKTEASKAKKSKAEKDGFSALSLSDDAFRDMMASLKKANDTVYTAEEIDEAVISKKAVNELDEALKELDATDASYEALPKIDKLFLTLQAHTAISSIKLDFSLLDGVDVFGAVTRYYQSGNIREGRDIMKSLFDKALNVDDGVLFYGVKIARKDLPREDVMNFYARFRGTAYRQPHTKDGVTTYGEFIWKKSEASKNVQISAITDLFAVILDRNKDYTVVKPEADFNK